ncbi:hydroxyacid dehydrogenase [Amycolatopsis alkalitolerans]|uniref:hydroxyacid dehydrogenase n=1 Tax=Amycolatopsis alkalitolerans TaxID=2547244 RepID=UPI001F21243D|nr:hydroxyacid dehydrogenase [Amycolatopsis alkalitolerans]
MTEDVWGEPLRELTGRWKIRREPGLWSDLAALEAAAREVCALVVRNRTPVTAKLLRACPRLKIVARAGVGLDNIDLGAANEAGVVVAAPLGANARSVAEHALGTALALARQTVDRDRDARAGGWNRSAGTELHGGTWGLLGAGATARACARLATAIGMKVLAYDPYVDPQAAGIAESGIRLVSLDELARASDVISCHLPATPETAGLVGREFLARVRPHVLFVNVGRGEAVDEDALADALDGGRVAGAALDVRTQEPPVPGRLEKLPNTVLTPHIAGITRQSQDRILRVLATDIDAVLSGAEARAMVGTVRKARAA